MLKIGLLVCLLSISAAAQSPKTPTFDPRLPFASIIREDLFAGFMADRNNNDNQRFLRGERNLEILLAERPADKAGLTA
jgi:hypothetical protein